MVFPIRNGMKEGKESGSFLKKKKQKTFIIVIQIKNVESKESLLFVNSRRPAKLKRRISPCLDSCHF
jgi:hypothetical protein